MSYYLRITGKFILSMLLAGIDIGATYGVGKFVYETVLSILSK